MPAIFIKNHANTNYKKSVRRKQNCVLSEKVGIAHEIVKDDANK